MFLGKRIFVFSFCKELIRRKVIHILNVNTSSTVVFFLILTLLSFFSVNAIPNVFYTRLENIDTILTEPTEFHITSTDTPFINSTVSLSNFDAWLFFDNIRPSDVIDNYLSGVLIKGGQFKNGINGRIAIYRNGTVIMPHPSSIKPLSVFTNENFEGDTLQLSLHTYYNNLGSFNNAIKSFILKRGYMATFANISDGSGYSRVFIADNEDLKVSIMPAELNAKVSFIRVFKHQWVSKKGWCGWNWNDYQLIKATCYYDWDAGGSTSDNIEYSPIRQKSGWPSWTTINSKENVSHLLGFNEPDKSDQANMNFAQIMEIWPEMLNSGLRTGSPAWANPWSGDGGNLFDFINKCEELNYRVDFVALHCYWGGKSPINWYNDLKYIHDVTGRPLWITEWNNGANWTEEGWPDNTQDLTPDNAQKQLNDLKGILQVLDTAHFVERYFIYNWVEDRRAMILADTLTPAGKYYAAHKSEIAYNSTNDVIPTWNYQVPELSIRYLTLSNSLRLSWIDPNGEICKGYTLERKIDNGDFEVIYTTDDISVLAYLDSLDSDLGSTTTYRLKSTTLDDFQILSNEVSSFTTIGTDTIQTGTFQINNFDWNTSLYVKNYENIPNIILGISTINNTIPTTLRVNNIKTSSFKFQIDPWDYLNDPVLAIPEDLAVISIPSGIYKFGDLKAEVKAVSDVARDWDTVIFEQEFTKPPVVFATVASNINFYPLTAAIRNVTTTGFEISLKSEEANTFTLSPETIDYLAIETGLGVIDGKRISVGKTEEGSGISSLPYIVEYDTSFTQPIVFAGMLSASDNFASTLKYYDSGSNTFSLIKHREMSGKLSATKEDVAGWMIMDIAPDQDLSASITKVTNSVLIYPNPVTNIINFDFNYQHYVEIYDLAGRKQMESEVLHSLDVSNLDDGIYILKLDNYSLTKFIKR